MLLEVCLWQTASDCDLFNWAQSQDDFTAVSCASPLKRDAL